MPLSPERKAEYFDKMKEMLSTYTKCFVVEVDNVGSNQLQKTRIGLRGKGEILMVNIGSTSVGGKIEAVKADLAKISLTSPVCTSEGEKIALSRRIDKHWRLIGWGTINRGITIEPEGKDSS